ncbi:hypothetical protein BDR26DRAFT_999268 [Obelidium mucronatum]|nr:hypothetical protein BDR26DRAFT_999268 [Obelidium mucronatum]
MQQTNENPYNGGPRASAAAVHGGWDDVAAAERAGAGQNSGSGSGRWAIIETPDWIWIWSGTWTMDFWKRGGEGAAETGPPAMHDAYAPSTSVPRGDRWRDLGGDRRLSNPRRRDGEGAAEMGPLAVHDAFAQSTPEQVLHNITTNQRDPTDPSDPTDPTKYTDPTERIKRNVIEKERRKREKRRKDKLNNSPNSNNTASDRTNTSQKDERSFIEPKRRHIRKKTMESGMNKSQHQIPRRVNRNNTNKDGIKKRKVKDQLKHSKNDTSKRAGKKETAKSKNMAGKSRQRTNQNKQSDNHRNTRKYEMSATEDLNQTINAHIKKTHIDELAEAGGIKERSSKAKLGRILNSVGITVPTIAETTLGNRLTFKCTRSQFHFLNQEIALRGDPRIFFEMSQEDETMRPTHAFDKFAGVKSNDQYRKEDPNSRSGKVVVTLSYSTEAEKIQALEVSGIPFNGHHVYPVDPNEPIQMRIDRERPRWLIAPDLDDGTELKDWFKVKSIEYQRIKITRDGLEILVTTTAEACRWDGKQVSEICTWEKNRKLKKNNIPKKTQQITTQANGYKVQTTVYRKYVMDQGTYRLRDHCRYCQKDHPSHLCQSQREQEELDWQRVADKHLVYNFSSANIKRIEKSVRGYAERNGGLTQAEASGCQTVRIKVDAAWIQKEDGRHHQRPRPVPPTQPPTKPALGRRMDNAWPNAQPNNTGFQPCVAYNATANHTNAAITNTLEAQIRELVKKVISEEMTNVMENLVNSRIAEELEEWKNEFGRERDERLAEEGEKMDEMREEETHPRSSPLSTWMEAVDKAISRMEENQLRTDQNIERIDRNIDRLEVETGVAQGVVFDINEEAMDIEDEDAEVTTPNALKLGRTKNE